MARVMYAVSLVVQWLRSKVLYQMNLCTFNLIHTHSPCPHATYSKAFKGYRPSLCPLGLALRSPSPFLSLPLTPLPHLPCLCCPRQPSRISLIDLCSPSILHGCYLCAIRLSSPITLASQTNGLYPLFNGTVISPHCLRAIMEGHKATASPSGF